MAFNRRGVFMDWRLGAMNTYNEEHIPINSAPRRNVSGNILCDKTNFIDHLNPGKVLDPKVRFLENQVNNAAETSVPAMPNSHSPSMVSKMKRKSASKKNSSLMMKENVQPGQPLPSKQQSTLSKLGINKNTAKKKNTTAATLSKSKNINDHCSVKPSARAKKIIGMNNTPLANCMNADSNIVAPLKNRKRKEPPHIEDITRQLFEEDVQRTDTSAQDQYENIEQSFISGFHDTDDGFLSDDGSTSEENFIACSDDGKYF
ncbi:hypothetical protein ACET3Z_026341 [Daucus carota]